MRRTTWTCECCGKLTDGRSGIDDAMDCFCDRCDDCAELGWNCLCDDESTDEREGPSWSVWWGQR